DGGAASLLPAGQVTNACGIRFFSIHYERTATALQPLHSVPDPGEGKTLNAVKLRRILDTAAEMFPDARCELVHSNPFELTIAVLLSAQCTDETVNKVTADLFQKYKRPEDYLAVPIEELQQDIRRIGLFRNKAANIQKLCRM